MATDYDAPRRSEEDAAAESLEELKTTQRAPAQTATIDVDEAQEAEEFELPGADLSGEELQVKVVPQQKDEFTCMSCFLVRHRSQIAKEKDGMVFCQECEG